MCSLWRNIQNLHPSKHRYSVCSEGLVSYLYCVHCNISILISFLIKTFIQNTETSYKIFHMKNRKTHYLVHFWIYTYKIQYIMSRLPSSNRSHILRWVIISSVQISRRYEVGLPHQAIIFPFDVHIQHYHQGRPDIDLVHETLIKQTTAQCNIPTCKHNMSASLNQRTSPTRNF